MSQDEINQGLRRMTESGKLDRATAREFQRQPLEAAKLVMLDDLKRETERQSVALFGDMHLTGGCNQGLVKDVREMRLIIFRAVWSISGVVAFCTFLLSMLALYIEATKK